MLVQILSAYDQATIAYRISRGLVMDDLGGSSGELHTLTSSIVPRGFSPPHVITQILNATIASSAPVVTFGTTSPPLSSLQYSLNSPDVNSPPLSYLKVLILFSERFSTRALNSLDFSNTSSFFKK